MTRSQRITTLCGIAALVVAGLIPPWREVLDLQALHQESPLGYAPIFLPPSGQSGRSVNIDVIRLLVQWVVIALVTGGIFFALNDAGINASEEQE